MNLMVSNPRVVAEHRELVLQCLVDEDVTIRLRALELITGMVTRRNLPEITARLLELRDDFAVIKAQVPFAAAIWVFNVVVMYVCVFRR
jgi:hypothetical protein